MSAVTSFSRIALVVSTHIRRFLHHIGAAGDAAFVLAVVALVAYLVLRVARRRRMRLTRLIGPYQMQRPDVESDTEELNAVVTLPVLRRASTALGRAGESTPLGRRLELVLRRSGVSIQLGELVLVWLVFLVFLVGIGALLGHIVGAIAALVLVLGAPPLGLMIALQRRSRKFAEQLPDILKLTASSLRAGFSFAQSLDGVVQQVKDPARVELQQALSETRLGKVLEEALADAAERIHNQDFSEAVMAVRIQQETGGNLSQLLDVLANTMTLRMRMRREIRTLTAEGRISAYVLGLLPVAIALFIYSTNRAYIMELFQTSAGRIAVLGAAVLELVGFIWMFRIVKIEV
jgi:tight adherence protein B